MIKLGRFLKPCTFQIMKNLPKKVAFETDSTEQLSAEELCQVQNLETRAIKWEHHK